MKIAASLVVSRETDANGLAIVELDEEANEGVSTFSPGSTINFLVHHDDTVKIAWVRATSGDVSSVTRTVTLDKMNQLLFTDVADTHDLTYVPNMPILVKWYGNEATGIKKTFVRTIEVTGLLAPALCDISYQVNFTALSMVAPKVVLEFDDNGKEIPYPLVIVVRMERVL